MELLQLDLSLLDLPKFRAIATQVPEGVGEGITDCCLPFWTGNQDWSRSVIKVLEGTSTFEPAHFPNLAEQDWLEQFGLLHSDRRSYRLDYLKRIGQALYKSLFPSDSSISQVFNSALRTAKQRQAALHLRLKFAEDEVRRSRLTDYPWELLHDGREFLLNQRVLLSRYIAYDVPAPTIGCEDRLRVLLVSARPQGLTQLDQTEAAGVQEGLKRAQECDRISLQILPSGTRRALNLYLTDCSPEQQPHVLHFDGHGVFGRRCPNEHCQAMHRGVKTEVCQTCGQRLPEPQGYLVFEGEQGQADYQSAREMARLLQPQSHGLRLVVLSACQSGMAIAGNSVFNGLAQNLIDQQIPAVVAMQYSVTVAAATSFAEQFYRVLGNQEPLLTAVSQGIREMGVEGDQWYRPVLYLRWRDNEGGQLFSSVKPAVQTKMSRFRQLELERLQGTLADREQDYKDVKRQLDVEGDAPRQNQLKKQLEILGQEMEQLEQQIQELEQGNAG